ncbi:hypothetical protein VPH35_126034 [Triticum aestivum]|nr:putative F-box/FBD/LRR-repeat protein At4g13965 [Triticum aestivum]
MRRRPGGRGARRVRGADRLGALPDAVLQHVLSFLPSRDAVRTSVLARRWRHQWKSVPALRITGVDAFESARHLNGFVNHLIVLRDRTTLHACEIVAYLKYEDYGEGSRDDDDEERERYTDLWVRYALSCHARLLRLSDHDTDNHDAKHEVLRSVILATPISSPHLTTLDFDGVHFSDECSLDFSGCPNLETLKMSRCSFLSVLSYDISSPSVRCLSITDCDFRRIDEKKQAIISVPSLVYLELAAERGMVPAFESTPSLLSASIKLEDSAHSWIRDEKDASLLLERFSDVTTSLDLIADRQQLAFRKDLKLCATFTKLRILSLNDWCVEPDFGPLLYILRRSPSLEKLRLRLSKPYLAAEETDGSYDSTEPFLVSKHLKVVEIKCRAKDERAHRISKALCSYGVSADKINIKERIRSSDGIYYESDTSIHSYSDPEKYQLD